MACEGNVFPVVLPRGVTRANFRVPPIAVTPEISRLLAENAPIAIGASGGKDSQCATWRVFEYLDEIGHTGPRLLIHSDLGRIEWEQSLPACEELARRLNAELVVVRRKAGDLIERWETRWRNNVARYTDLSCVKLILPTSTPTLRFCTSELKTEVICAELSRRFPGKVVLNVVGIRREESSGRAKAPICSVQPKLSRKKGSGYNWHPIIEWSLDEVLGYLASRGETLHPAYTEHGCSRVSCSFCIMSSASDMKASAGCAGNADAYRLLVDLERRSTFSFQGGKWLADVAPHLLDEEARNAMGAVKERARVRTEAEARIPHELLYTSGWPTGLPTYAQAELLAEVRNTVAQAVGIEVKYVTAESILQRYAELMAERAEKTVPSSRSASKVPSVIPATTPRGATGDLFERAVSG